MKRTMVVLVLAGSALQLAACSSSTPSPSTSTSTSASSSPSPSPSPSVASASTSASTAATQSTVTTAPAAAYPASEVCAYLKDQVPALKSIGTPVGAHANLVGNLFGFLQSHGIAPDSAALDEATTARCPEVRQEILSLTHLESFLRL